HHMALRPWAPPALLRTARRSFCAASLRAPPHPPVRPSCRLLWGGESVKLRGAAGGHHVEPGALTRGRVGEAGLTHLNPPNSLWWPTGPSRGPRQKRAV